ncbi:hypothetical protein G7Z17_g6452 [Cylindrodendrum hubeiense]|uniref:Uncharacterized protein n=1 Tax=Cylindrodendrum hubeiense TaxID=595255 RepID=A0A9P5H4P3_9HYPO|nr:hypothetical protein G7Z17_g6452 [Cylindrodendrum hubeiense]
MKAVFFSAVALAVSAFAAPSIAPPIGGEYTDQIEKIAPIENVVPIEGGDSLVPDLGIFKRSSPISCNEDLLSSLGSTGSAAHDITSSIQFIVNKYTDGKISKEDAADQSLPELKKIESLLTNLCVELDVATGIEITAAVDVKAVLDHVVDLVSTVLVTLNTLVAAIGLQPSIKLIVASLCRIISKLLILITTLVASVAPALTSALGVLIRGLGQGVLAPFLGSVLGSTDGILSALGL